MKFVRRRWNMSQRKASQGWSVGRTVDDMELEGIQENLLVGFISRFSFVKDPWSLTRKSKSRAAPSQMGR
jgi:hypothetical protein